MNARLATAGLALAFVAATPAAAVNLLTNGSFDQSTFVGGSFGFPNAQQVNPGQTTLPGWTVSVAELAWDRNGQAGIVSQDGLYNLDLTGFNDSQGTYGKVSQTVTTQAGATYRLSFYGGSYTPDPSIGGIAASAGAVSQNFTIPAAAAGGGVAQWTLFSLTFVATGTSTEIALGGINPTNADPTFIGLDNVSLDLIAAPGGVPEPASWALMIAGFGLAGAAARRRSVRQVGA